ncbi:MAG: MMPL family transporter [Hyphomicrobiales bacterium]|nr:MMPL family transporter [Hyphomicrobiales bacterium]
MLRSKIVSIVQICTRFPWIVIVVAALLTTVTAIYSVRNFAINTNVNRLISRDLDWRQRELAVDRSFPHRNETILAVVEAPTSELATEANAALIKRLREQPKHFQSVQSLNESEFFQRHALLFAAPEEAQGFATQFSQAQLLIQVLHTDPSLRGLVQALTFGLAGLQRKLFTLDDMARPLSMIAATLEDVVAGRPASFSWRALVNGRPPSAGELRRYILIKPVLDFTALEPGGAATAALRQAVADLKLESQYRARVRLTGAIPIQDEEFGTLKEHWELNAVVSLGFLIGILWLALGSARIIVAVLISIFSGLAMTAAAGLWLVGSLNPISVAFAVLFVGIGIDFGIQFGVRYRAERYEVDHLRVALARAARHVGVPLTLAATATAAGFMSFLPTAYRGLSELGLIAGLGMIIAFFVSITLLPALLKLFNPPGEKEPLGYASLAPVDAFMERHRVPIIVGTAVISLGGLPLLYYLQFDFNPMNLRSPRVESVATFLELRSDPNAGANAIDVLTRDREDARAVAERLRKIPEVNSVITLDTFIPADQEQKLAAIRVLAKALEPALKAPARPTPADEDNVAALNRGADALRKAAANQSGPGAEAAMRLAGLLTTLAKGDQALRDRATAAFAVPLRTALDGLQQSLRAEPITADNLPPELKANWIAEDGRARVEAHPKGDANDNEVLRQFARAVLAVEPRASGGPISILESGQTVVRAFIEAGFWAFVSIAILLWVVLRRFTDVWLTLLPLALAGVVTLEICVLIGLKLNFANIIALPLLLGVGVAFKIYYIMAWRAGQTQLLQSPLTRAVMYSALATATAFGSLWLSSHPGTSSMGKLLALSLVTTLAAAVLFQPVLMGPPREIGDS